MTIEKGKVAARYSVTIPETVSARIDKAIDLEAKQGRKLNRSAFLAQAAEEKLKRLKIK